jgi:hypothetical protein
MVKSAFDPEPEPGVACVSGSDGLRAHQYWADAPTDPGDASTSVGYSYESEGRSILGFVVPRAMISGVRDRLPQPQPLCDQLHAPPIVVSVQDAHAVL